MKGGSTLSNNTAQKSLSLQNLVKDVHSNHTVTRFHDKIEILREIAVFRKAFQCHSIENAITEWKKREILSHRKKFVNSTLL